ncbi:FecR family protein [Spirosoma pollinicola]|uniref:Iron dicitrate transport regulator FecR n=1 Tax=Spirosoma pollinicola TaxID=2057025 RepID=A0A2K8YUM2_9BACT|nr:FecR family protein [Spirosoma pollinicola]AUD01327.1 iron dicitrate transport regulator FecR [Spirosoma pollinicola]
MSRKKFGQLLQKYLRGECTPREKLFVEHWYGLLETETGESGQEIDLAELEGRLWNQIQQKMDTNELADETPVIPIRTVSYRWLGIAASLILVGIWFYAKNPIDLKSIYPLTANSQTDWIERSNKSAQPLAIRLEDGSTVQLAPKSSLRFPKRFAVENRTVYLTGDAFFSIQKMPSRPFYIHTDKVVTKVLGTSFFIRTLLTNSQVRVEVVTGRVTVYKEEEEKEASPNRVVLSPNQTATFYSREDHLVTGLVDSPKLIKPVVSDQKPLTFQFDDAPLAEVLATLEQAYGINIDVVNDQLKNCPLTADLTNQPLYTQLDIICAALKSTYEIKGTTILINGKGCI